MRTLHPQLLEDRKRKLLQVVIYHYVQTAEPVGSEIVARKYRFGLSSATLRSMLADLEEEGYLTHPHTSAGRVPTDKGYRFYVNSLAEIQHLALSEEERIRKEYEARAKELEDLLRTTSRMLSAMSHCSGFVLSPRFEESVLRRLELIPLGEEQVLAILITQTGMIRHKVVECPKPIPPNRLGWMSRFLNERLTGLTLSQIREQHLDRLEEAQEEYEETLALAKRVISQAFHVDPEPEQELFVDGARNLVALPDFQDYDQLRNVLRVMEQKKLLAELLNKEMRKEGIRVKIGSENPRPELRNVSVISSIYKAGDQPIGVLGILGPRRMEYAHMIALVDSVSKAVNGVLERRMLP